MRVALFFVFFTVLINCSSTQRSSNVPARTKEQACTPAEAASRYTYAVGCDCCYCEGKANTAPRCLVYFCSSNSNTANCPPL